MCRRILLSGDIEKLKKDLSPSGGNNTFTKYKDDYEKNVESSLVPPLFKRITKLLTPFLKKKGWLFLIFILVLGIMAYLGIRYDVDKHNPCYYSFSL